MTKKIPKTPPARKRRQKTSEADWGGQDSDLLRRVISAITLNGGAVRFGYSRDGGAYSIGVYGDGKPYSEFHPEDDGVAEWIEGFADDYE